MNEPTTRLRLDLPLLLPDADDRCVGRLIAALSGRPGISEAHVARDADAPQLCIHYGPAQINIGRVRELVHAAGAEVSERFGHLVVRADAALHARAARSVADGNLATRQENLPTGRHPARGRARGTPSGPRWVRC